MSNINKDLGMATAYAYAVSQGYEGTEEEFAELMASYASVAQEAGEARDEAEDARDLAISAKDTAVEAVEGFEDTVDTATATAVQTIQGEGSTQVTAVQDKGDEVLGSIPADYTQLSQNVTDLKSDLSHIDTYLYDSTVPSTDYRKFELESGYIEANGKRTTNPIFIRNKGIMPIDNSKELVVITGTTDFKWWFNLYDENFNVLSTKGSYTDAVRAFPTSNLVNVKYVAITGRKPDSSSINPSDYTIKIYQQDVLPINVLANKNSANIQTLIKAFNKDNTVQKTLVFEQGRLVSGTGLPIGDYSSHNSKWVRTKEPMLVCSAFPIVITRTHSLNGVLYEYDSNGVYITEKSLTNSFFGAKLTLNASTYYINIAFGNNSGSDITPSSADTTTVTQIMALDSDPSYVPNYFKEQLDTKIPTIIENMNDVGKNGETFIFITDLHWETNYKRSPALIQYILDRTNIKHIICGGDLFNEGEKQAMCNIAINCVKSFQFPLSEMFFPVARGNHDDNSNWGTAEQIAEHELSYGTVFNIIMNQVTDKVHFMSNDNFSFYYDHEASKTRFLFVDTGRSSSSNLYLANVRDVLYTVETGWKVIVVCHYLLYLNNSVVKFYGSPSNLAKMLRDYNAKTTGTVTYVDYDFTNSHGEVCFMIGGHTHSDLDLEANAEENTYHILAINTDTDSYRDHSGTEGTVNSQCFDVVTVDYANRTVKCVRIGRGNDRSFAY